MKRISFVLCALLVSAALSSVASATEITVSAAASLTNAFTEVKTAFEKRNPSIKVTTNFAASNPLLKQIETGAPVDVFASADQATMNRAGEKDLIVASTRRNFAKNGLVLITPAKNPAKIVKLNDTLSAKVKRVAVGNPASVPAGRYAKEVLGLHNLWDKLQAKLIMGESVRQVLDYVVRGETDCAFVYSTDARHAGAKVKVIEEVKGKTPILYPISVIKKSKKQKDAQKFVDFVLSKEGQNILQKYGFSSI